MMGNNTSPSQFVGWTVRSREGKKCREKFLLHYFQVGTQWNTALMSVVRRGRGLKEIHIEIFLPALPCTWQIPGRTWPLGSDLLKASWGKSTVRSLLNHAKRRHWRRRGHVLWKRMRWMWAGDLAWAGPGKQYEVNTKARGRKVSGAELAPWGPDMTVEWNCLQKTRIQWTWCTHLWVRTGKNRSGVIRAMWNRSSFGSSTLGWAGEWWRENVTEEQSSGTWRSERLHFQASSGHDNADSESQKESKYMHAGGEASTFLTAFPLVLGRLQFKAQAELEGAWLQCHTSAGSTLLSELCHCPGTPNSPTTTRRDQHSSLSPQNCTPGEVVQCCSKSSICLEIKINRIMSAEQAPGHTHGYEPCPGKVHRKTLW